MSEVSSSAPGQRPPPTNSGGPKAVARPNPTHDHPEADREKTDEKPGQKSPADQNAKSYYDPAVSVAPSLAHLAIGQLVRGDVVAKDGEGRPILRTAEGTFALRPDAGLVEGDKVSIRITESGKTVLGDLILRDGRPIEPPIALNLTLIGIHPDPGRVEDIPDDLPKEPVQNSYRAGTSNPAPVVALDYEASTLSLPRAESVPARAAPEVPNSLSGNPVAPANLVSGVIQVSGEAVTLVMPDHQSAKPIIKAYGTAPLILTPGQIPHPGVVLSIPARAEGPDVSHAPLFRVGENIAVRIIGNDAVHQTRATGGIIVQAAIVPNAASPVKAPEGLQLLQTPVGTIAIRTPAPLPAHQILTVLIEPAVARTETRTGTGSRQQTPVTITQQIGPKQQTDSQPARKTPALFDPATLVSAKSESILNAPVLAGPIPTASPLPALPPGPSPALAETWPFLADIHTALALLPPHIASEMAIRIPRLDAKLPSTLLFLTHAFQRGSFQQWAGQATVSALEQSGHQSLIAKLDEEFSKIGRVFVEPRIFSEMMSDGWRPLPLPLMTDQGLDILSVLVRPVFDETRGRQSRKGEQEDEKKQVGSRFILEFVLSKLGSLQLDGLIRDRHFDLIIRSRKSIPESAMSELQNLFATALLSRDMDGALSFDQKAVFPIIVTELLTRIHHSDYHENMTV